MAGLYTVAGGDVTASPRRTLNITPADSDLDFLTRSIRANGAGVIAVVNADGTTATCNFLAGETRVMSVSQIKSTGTTATGIEASF